jgi:hypothetical protein
MKSLLSLLSQGSTLRGLVYLASATLLYVHPELAATIIPATFGTAGAIGVAVSDPPKP